MRSRPGRGDEFETLGKSLKKRRFGRRRLFSTLLFVLATGAVCLVLYASALPRSTAAIRDLSDGTAYIPDIVDAEANAAENRATASGRARITEPAAQSRLLARRAALTSARRNLLALRQRLLGDPGFARRVSGRVPPHGIVREGVEGDWYFVELAVRLDELLKPGFNENSLVLR